MRKLKIQRKLKNFNSNVKTKINNEIKRKGKKGFIWEIIFSFLIFCASAVLIFVLYIIIMQCTMWACQIALIIRNYKQCS